ncbi:hypothetical protein BST61_g8173 [Cercospora zeina]
MLDPILQWSFNGLREKYRIDQCLGRLASPLPRHLKGRLRTTALENSLSTTSPSTNPPSLTFPRNNKQDQNQRRW